MADTAQPPAKVQLATNVRLATKARLVAFCKQRGHSQGEVVEAALEAYFTPADGDAQALLFQKVNEMGQGMKDVVTLLGTVIQHLERQAKPPPPKMATRDELYPDLALASLGTPALPAVEEAPPLAPRRGPWQTLFGRRGTV